MPNDSPKPFKRTHVSTYFLRIPRVDWARITTGEKRQHREQGRWGPRWANMHVPIPILGYSYPSHGGPVESVLLVLEDAWSEPLGAISDESLEAEGFASLAEFRRYWKNRKRETGWRPLSTVQVYCVRPFTQDDRLTMGQRLLELLYAGHLPT
jgi:hypothetical protein